MSSEHAENLIAEIRAKSDRIQQLPQLITDQNINNREALEDLKQTLKIKQQDFETEAGMEVDNGGAKLFTNQKQREARAAELMKTDPECQQLNAEYRKMEADQINAGIQRDQYRNELSALKAVLAALTEVLRHENILIAASNNKARVEVCHVTQ